MKTIEQASAGYAATFHLGSEFGEKMAIGAMKAFKAGVEFAQEWISVEKELPKDSEIILVKYRCDGYELPVNIGRLRMCLSFYSVPAKKWQIDNNCKVVFWRPIELK